MFSRTLFSTLLAIVLFAGSFAHAQDLSRNGNPHNREGREDFRREREKFYRDMHRAEPGLNWKAIDEETRRMKSDRILEQKRSRYKGATPQSEIETFPNGLSGTWSERGSNNVAGRMHSSDIDLTTNTIYAVSSYGNIWRKHLTQYAWRCFNDDRRFNDVRMLRVLPGVRPRVIALSNGPASLYYSDNSGVTWEQATGLDAIFAWGGFRRGIIMSDNKTIYALGNEWSNEQARPLPVLYVSRDMGTSFKRMRHWDHSLEQMDIWASRTDPTSLYLAKADSVFELINDKFVLYSTAPYQYDLDDAQYLMLQGRVEMGVTKLRMIAYKGGQSTLYRAGIDSTLWELGGSIPSGAFNVNSFAVSQDNSGYMYFGGMETFRSSNDGDSWTKFSEWWEYYDAPDSKLHADVPAIEILTHPLQGEMILISTDGGLFVSKDNGETVTNYTLDGIGTSQYYSTYTSEQEGVIFAGSQDQGFQQSLEDTTGILPFVQTYSGDYGHVGSSDDGRTVWTDYPGFVMVYPNAIYSDEKYVWNFVGENQLWLPPVVVDPYESTVAYVANGDGQSMGSYIWRLSYAGTGEIQAEKLPFDFSEGSVRTITAFAISTLDDRYWYVLTDDGAFFTSEDMGETFTQSASFKGPSSHYFYGASVVPSKLHFGTVYVAGSGYSNDAVYVTEDHGANFQAISTGLPPTLVFDLAVDTEEEMLYAATEVGPYAYDLALGQWFDIQGTTAPDHVYWSVEYLPGTNVARFGTHGRGIWDFSVTSNASVRTPNTPTEALRVTASPSIFKDQCKISLTVSDAQRYAVRVFDITGRLIEELHNGELSAGEHTFSWDRTSQGSPNGFYTCVVTGGGSTAAIKVQAVK